jgi:hypothetical protein
MIGCKQSPDRELDILHLPSGNQSDDLTAENQDANAEEVPLHKKMFSTFDVVALADTRDYLGYSWIAHESATNLGAVAKVLNVHYDWKQDPETTRDDVRGGMEDPLGKFLMIMAVERQHDEAIEGVTIILEDEKLLRELLVHFTSEEFISEENLIELKQAISNNDVENIKRLINLLYGNVLEHYGVYYHILSQATDSGVRRSGFFPGERQFLIGKLDQSHVETGSRTVETQHMQHSPLRLEVVNFITRLIQRYFQLPIIQKSAPEEDGDTK